MSPGYLAPMRKGDAVRYELVSGPTGMAVDAVTGILTWTPNATGSETVRVKATDGQGGETEAEFCRRHHQRSQQQPCSGDCLQPATIPLRPAWLYAYDLVARDPDGGPVVWSLVSGPQGMSLDFGAGDAPLESCRRPDRHVYSSPCGRWIRWLAFGEQTFTIQISCSNAPPVISSRPPTVAYANEQYLYAVRATDPENDPLTFELATAPAGMFLGARHELDPLVAHNGTGWQP
jgi:hypothetical protein